MNFAKHFFRSNPLLRPCTIIRADATQLEISAVFERREQINPMGDTSYQNFVPFLVCATEDVPAVAQGDTGVVHYGFLKDEQGRVVLDEAGNKIIAENEFTYKIKTVAPDADGFTDLMLTFNEN